MSDNQFVFFSKRWSRSWFGIIGLSILLQGRLYAQDPQFSQFYGATLYENPAFAGSGFYPRIILHQRLQWPGIDAKYLTTLLSFDKYFSKYHNGISVMFLHDVQGHNRISSSELYGQYSHDIALNDEFSLRGGLQAGLVSRTTNYASLSFLYQYNDFGFIDGSSNMLENDRKLYMDFGAGGLLYSNEFWFGFSTHHLNRPDQSVLNERSLLPIKYSVITGFKFRLNKAKKLTFEGYQKDVSLAPTLHYKTQGKSDQFDIGIYGVYDHIIYGIWYRGIPVKKFEGIQNNESMVFMVGWKKLKSFEFRYSFDATVSTLRPAGTAGSHEFSISMLLHKSGKHKPLKRLPCPSHQQIKMFQLQEM